MKALQIVKVTVCVTFLLGSGVCRPEDPPAWAYPMNPPGFKPPPDEGGLRTVPGSTATYTLTQLRDLFATPDWHPKDRPPMPEVVSRGRKPGVYACGVCHRAEGTGGPENANIAGLPADYIIQQMRDYKSGARQTAAPERLPSKLMIALAKDVTEAEVAEAAKFFSAIKPRRNITVRETATVPKTQVSAWFLVPTGSAETEPIGQRIIEVADDVERFVNRDPRVSFIAYVPEGSIERGRRLASGDNGRTIACASCHGPDLKGAGAVPGIAGRSPTYAFRQLYDYKQGARQGVGSGLMKPAVEKLSVEDMLALAAYAASLQP